MNLATAFFVLSVTTLLCTRDAKATKKSKVCGMRNWPSCALGPVDIVTSNYSILPESLYSEDDDEMSFSRKLRATGRLLNSAAYACSSAFAAIPAL